MTTQQQLDEAADLETLCTLLNAVHRSDLLDLDLTALPTFGGPAIEATPDIYSWDVENVLWCDTANGGAFAVVSREAHARDEAMWVRR